MTALPAELAATFGDRRVLVTGGLGFIGSNLARELVAAGSTVTLIDSLMPTHGGTCADEVRAVAAAVRDAARA